MFNVRRREFITLLGGAAAAWPMAALGQHATPTVGFMHPASPATWPYAEGFRRGLQEAGYIAGQNVTIEYRWAEDHYDRLPALAAELVAKRVAVIAAGGGLSSILAAKAATSQIPIVFFTGTDPIADGLVTSFSRPDGNLTGAYVLANTLVAKQLEILHELLPGAANIAVLENAADQSSVARLRELSVAALALGLKLRVLSAGSEDDFAAAFASLVAHPADALLVAPSPFFTTRRDRIIALAAPHALPMIGGIREFAVAGGLMSYGSNFTEGYRLIGHYTARVLKGATPADLPVQQASKVEFVVNLRTAKTLGLTLPLPLIGRADEVIE
jgi:putative ABC transport system substrate-binding protein